MRWKDEERLIIISNFDASDSLGFELQLPPEMTGLWNLPEGSHQLKDQLSGRSLELMVSGITATTRVDIGPLESFILKFE